MRSRKRVHNTPQPIGNCRQRAQLLKMLLDYLLLLIITALLICAVIKIKLNKKPFQLKKLQHVAFRNVINSMDINKVIDLASTSTRFRQRLRQAQQKDTL
uniref:Uncharacterized protein n=1 Tax=Caenorhabditis elegans TaxID=6239 RepID=U4PLM3_CAEEL|eukprot:NP_001293542.1 Uncharacterized protein CELE_C24H12.18 [Caenorhabditis elegans]